MSMAYRQYMAQQRHRYDRLVTEYILGPLKLTLVRTRLDPVLIEGDQFEMRLANNGDIVSTEVIIGRRAALERFEAMKPLMATTIAKIAMRL